MISQKPAFPWSAYACATLAAIFCAASFTGCSSQSRGTNREQPAAKQPAAARSIPLMAAPRTPPAEGELAEGWNFRFLDRSSGAPKPHLSYAAGAINFHFTSAGPTEWPIRALLTFDRPIPAGKYQLSGKVKIGGNNGLVQIRSGKAANGPDYHVVVSMSSARGDSERAFSGVITLPPASGPSPLDVRLSGDGAFWGTLTDFKLTPVQD
jgi:hypothetical protein